MLIVDAHQDLAWSMLTFGRDYTLSAAQIRLRERATAISALTDDAMLGWPDYQRGGVAVVFASLFATPERFRTGEWDKISYTDLAQASRLYRAQLDLYERLADDHNEKFRLIHSRQDLEDLLQIWETPPRLDPQTGEVREGNPVGLVVLMEGADPLRDPGELEEWWQWGVRLISPAWASTRYCGGTGEPGPLTSAGYALLERMSELGFGLDLSHMDESAVLQALDFYPGHLMATHGNAQTLLKGDDSNRHLSDHVIRGILERDGVIGVLLYNPFLKAGWARGDRREEVTTGRVIAQMDYICQLAGDASHVGFGTDFDGGVGLQTAPLGIDTIADLSTLAPLLIERGYSQEDCAAIFGRNWISMLRKVLP
jgi:membrane dipeptidase